MALGGTRKADAISWDVRPSTDWRISGARIAGRSPDARKRTSGPAGGRGLSPATRPPLPAPRPSAPDAPRRRPRGRAVSPASAPRRRATVRSHAAGFSGTPPLGHWRSAAAKASDSASSAAATSPVRAARKATSRPKLSRATRSAARPASLPVAAARQAGARGRISMLP